MICPYFTIFIIFVKLQSKVQASALGLGVDFVFALSQQEQQEQQDHHSPKYKHPTGLVFETKTDIRPNPLYINSTPLGFCPYFFIPAIFLKPEIFLDPEIF